VAKGKGTAINVQGKNNKVGGGQVGGESDCKNDSDATPKSFAQKAEATDGGLASNISGCGNQVQIPK
jgi:hypothetical protein